MTIAYTDVPLDELLADPSWRYVGKIEAESGDPLLDPIFLRYAIDHRTAVFENMEHLQREHFFVGTYVGQCTLQIVSPDSRRLLCHAFSQHFKIMNSSVHSRN